ncbi:MAG: 5,6-dimethylbenzimidazole synthase [Verrucomicrobia bacterium]|nr:5,6-dimethylbenzimidazole synthase [Verrucomicrobiota bacterium]
MAVSQSPFFSEGFSNELRLLLEWRRDVRRFRTDPLPDGLVEELVGLASLGPSVGYSQPCRFVRVDDPRRRASVMKSYECANRAALASYQREDAELYSSLKLAGLSESPVHLAAFCDCATSAGKGLGRQSMPQALQYSAVMAICILWLTARARGVGVGWVSILEPEIVTRALEVPESWELIGYLCLGYPLDDDPEPELMRLGWEKRDIRAATLIDR